MKKRLLQFIPVLMVMALVALTSISCMPKGEDIRLHTTNKSPNTLYFSISGTDDIQESLEINYKNPKTKFLLRGVKPHSQEYIKYPGAWEDFFEDADKKQMRIFVIDSTTVADNPWGNIIRNQIYSKYKITLKDVRNVNWLIDIDSLRNVGEQPK